MEIGGGGGGEMSPLCSAVSASSAGGAGGVPSPSPTHTDTHASLYNGCFTLVPGRERVKQRRRHGEKTKGRHGGGSCSEKKKERKCYEERGNRAEGNASEARAVETSGGRRTD